MEFDNSFVVPLPVDEAWVVLMDIERIAPCLPGAELTETIDERNYKGTVSVRLGPVALTFAGTASFEEIDEAGHNARVRAQGSDAKGRGGANANVTFRLVAGDGGTRVDIHTDMQLSGSVAQYGRGVGMITDLASRLISQFAENLQKQLAEREEAGTESAPATPPSARPISGFSLGLQVMWAALVRAIKRLFGGGK